jgi:hypothetical protein
MREVTFQEQIIKIINENKLDQLAKFEAKDLNFHFHYFLSNDFVQNEITRYSRDTPIHIVVRKNQLNMLDLMLNKGVNVSTIFENTN